MPRLLALAVALSLLGGCKSKQRLFEEKAKEATGADEVHVEENGKRVTLSQTDDAGGGAEIEVGREARIPADFPKNIPIYPGSKIVAAVSMSEHGKRGHLVTLSAEAPADDVVAYYKKRLPDLGKLQEVGIGGMRVLTVEPAGMKISATISTNGAGTTIQLSALPT